MKKAASLLLAFIMLFALMPLSLAAEYQDANWLYADWDINGYPDDVGGVFSYDGDGTHLCIMLVGDDGTREKEIRSMLESDENLRFASCTRTHKELAAMQSEIESAYMNETYGVNSCGIGMNADMTEAVVTVGIAEEKYAETAAILTEKYGDAVSLSGGGAVDTTADAEEETASEPEPKPEPTEAEKQRAKRQLVTYMIVYTIVVAGMAFALYYRRKKKAEERK